MTTKRDLAQILRHMADKHRGQLGITHVPISLGLLDEICEALHPETAAPQVVECRDPNCEWLRSFPAPAKHSHPVRPAVKTSAEGT